MSSVASTPQISHSSCVPVWYALLTFTVPRPASRRPEGRRSASAFAIKRGTLRLHVTLPLDHLGRLPLHHPVDHRKARPVRTMALYRGATSFMLEVYALVALCRGACSDADRKSATAVSEEELDLRRRHRCRRRRACCLK